MSETAESYARREQERADRVRALRFQIAGIEAKIKEIEGPDRCEVCQFMVLGPASVKFEGRYQMLMCARFPPRCEVAPDYGCGEFRRKRSDG